MPISAREYWEDYLREKIRSNLERDTLRNETAVAQHLLANGDALHPFYEAIHPSHYGGVCWEILLQRVLQVCPSDRSRPVFRSASMDEMIGVIHSSVSDLLCGLLVTIEHSQGEWIGAIPCDFEMPNEALAALINVLLELPADAKIDAKYVTIQRNKYRAAIPQPC
jgi:hypothetical protein